MPNILAKSPYKMGGISASIAAAPSREPDSTKSGRVDVVANQVAIPATIERMAPKLVARFQYKPAINGVKRDTRLKAEDSPTNA